MNRGTAGWEQEKEQAENELFRESDESADITPDEVDILKMEIQRDLERKINSKRTSDGQKLVMKDELDYVKQKDV